MIEEFFDWLFFSEWENCQFHEDCGEGNCCYVHFRFRSLPKWFCRPNRNDANELCQPLTKYRSLKDVPAWKQQKQQEQNQQSQKQQQQRWMLFYIYTYIIWFLHSTKEKKFQIKEIIMSISHIILSKTKHRELCIDSLDMLYRLDICNKK